ncbi:MAG: deoxynucleoside kinase, partial [Flammeovirgaceae bacterium]
MGAGKSTLLSLLNLSVIKEPVEEWEHMVGGNLLKNYYEDPKRWAFTFQLNALHSRNMLWNKTIRE